MQTSEMRLNGLLITTVSYIMFCGTIVIWLLIQTYVLAQEVDMWEMEHSTYSWWEMYQLFGRNYRSKDNMKTMKSSVKEWWVVGT